MIQKRERKRFQIPASAGCEPEQRRFDAGARYQAWCRARFRARAKRQLCRAALGERGRQSRTIQAMDSSTRPARDRGPQNQNKVEDDGTSPNSRRVIQVLFFPASAVLDPTAAPPPGNGLNGTNIRRRADPRRRQPSKAKTIREYNKKNHYNDWIFIYDPTSDRGGLLVGPWQTSASIDDAGRNPGRPTHAWARSSRKEFGHSVRASRKRLQQPTPSSQSPQSGTHPPSSKFRTQ